MFVPLFTLALVTLSVVTVVLVLAVLPLFVEVLSSATTLDAGGKDLALIVDEGVESTAGAVCVPLLDSVAEGVSVRGDGEGVVVVKSAVLVATGLLLLLLLSLMLLVVSGEITLGVVVIVDSGVDAPLLTVVCSTGSKEDIFCCNCKRCVPKITKI